MLARGAGTGPFSLIKKAQQWWHMPLILELRRQADLCEFEASLVYRTTRAVTEELYLEKQTNKKI